MDSSEKQITKLANYLITAFVQTEKHQDTGKITVNTLVSKVAAWYEKLRNAMDYREEEVILRASVERILKRRLLLGGDGQKVAEPLVRELVWAHYFTETNISEAKIIEVGQNIDVHLALRKLLIEDGQLSEKIVTEWMFHLLSASLEQLLITNKKKAIIANFMFHVVKENVDIIDDSEQTRDAQVFIAIRRSFAKDDLAFLRYYLFLQLFGSLTEKNLEEVARGFMKGYEEITYQLHYPRKDRIYSYVKNITAVFFILEDLLNVYGSELKMLVKDQEAFKRAVFEACDARYAGVASKVRRAIARSVVFILLTKVFFAFGIEGAIETLLYGEVLWVSLAINTVIPPVLMILTSFFLLPPGRENSQRIFSYLQKVFFEERPQFDLLLSIYKTPVTRKSMDIMFNISWFLGFILSFGILIFILSQLHFMIISQIIFLFFITIVSFLTYRIGIMSRIYRVEDKPGILAPIADFFFMPIVRVGRNLTEGISQVNIFLFALDFIFETPFKGLFGFFEQLFFFLHAKREELE